MYLIQTLIATGLILQITTKSCYASRLYHKSRERCIRQNDSIPFLDTKSFLPFPPSSQSRISNSTFRQLQIRGGKTISSPSTSSSTSSSSSSSKIKTKTKRKHSKTRKSKLSSSDKIQNSSLSSSSSLNKKHKKNKMDSKEGTKKISDTLKESDSAKSLGDAIRDRKDLLQQDEILEPLIHHIDASLLSLGLSLGTSDPRGSSISKNQSTSIHKTENKYDAYNPNIMDGGGVEASRTSILANYFLQSHGGAYAFQCAVSALSVITGLTAIVLPFYSTSSSSSSLSSWNTLKMVCIRRSLLCALLKHASGLMAAAVLSARRIPDIGLYETRKRMKELASDPVAQYLFYCAFLLVWLPVSTTFTNISSSSTNDATNVARITNPLLPWYLDSKMQKSSILCFLGPILLREIIHLTWVLYDVCVILGASSSTLFSPFLTIAQGGMDAFMSLLLTPNVWRNADSRMKQRHLAKLVSRASLGLELCTGGIIGIDLVRAVTSFTFAPLDKRPKIRGVLAKILCGRFYFNFMLVRRKKIVDLVGTIRGGAGYFPSRVLDVLLEPKKAMGLLDDDDELEHTTDRLTDKVWMSYIGDALGI